MSDFNTVLVHSLIRVIDYHLPYHVGGQDTQQENAVRAAQLSDALNLNYHVEGVFTYAGNIVMAADFTHSIPFIPAVHPNIVSVDIGSNDLANLNITDLALILYPSIWHRQTISWEMFYADSYHQQQTTSIQQHGFYECVFAVMLTIITTFWAAIMTEAENISLYGDPGLPDFLYGQPVAHMNTLYMISYMATRVIPHNLRLVNVSQLLLIGGSY